MTNGRTEWQRHFSSCSSQLVTKGNSMLPLFHFFLFKIFWIFWYFEHLAKYDTLCTDALCFSRSRCFENFCSHCSQLQQNYQFSRMFPISPTWILHGDFHHVLAFQPLLWKLLHKTDNIAAHVQSPGELKDLAFMKIQNQINRSKDRLSCMKLSSLASS